MLSIDGKDKRLFRIQARFRAMWGKYLLKEMIKLEKDTNNISKINSKILKLIPKTILTRNEAKIISKTLWNIKKGRK